MSGDGILRKEVIHRIWRNCLAGIGKLIWVIISDKGDKST
jgi:hypothetical protein